MPSLLLTVIMTATGIIFSSPWIRLVVGQTWNPTSDAADIQTRASLPWYAAVIIFVAIAVGVTLLNSWISKSSKKKFIQTCGCVPLVDGDERPFKPQEDEPLQPE